MKPMGSLYLQEIVKGVPTPETINCKHKYLAAHPLMAHVPYHYDINCLLCNRTPVYGFKMDQYFRLNNGKFVSICLCCINEKSVDELQ
jgi:hypothetical protein